MNKIGEQEIRRVAERIGRQADAEQVILFGSYARGEATEHSDVDLLVASNAAAPSINRYARIHSAWTCWYIPRTK